MLRMLQCFEFQFTPLREGRRNVRRGWNRQPISIHAPPRGATKPTSSHSSLGINFNSRPSARGDRVFRYAGTAAEHFNSRPSARGDSPQPGDVIVFYISIHAPPRGATRNGKAAASTMADFNSRPSARGDGNAPNLRNSLGQFQFTPLREGRRQSMRGNIIIFYFNSRPSARGDDMLEEYSSAYQFQFTPLREGRRFYRHALPALVQFQFTPLREGRPASILALSANNVLFQFTPLREGRPRCMGTMCSISPHFNSRPSARGDSHDSDGHAHPEHFNSRPSARGDGQDAAHRCADCPISIHAPPRGATH